METLNFHIPLSLMKADDFGPVLAGWGSFYLNSGCCSTISVDPVHFVTV